MDLVSLGSYPRADIQVDLTEAARHLGVTLGPEGWAAVHAATTTPAFTDYLAGLTGQPDLVIGIELPNCIYEALDATGLPVIDLGIGPLRFGEDLFLECRTNRPALLDLLRPFQPTEADLMSRAAMIHGLAMRRDANTRDLASDYGRIGVIFGQSQMDSSLLSGGRVIRFADRADRVASWARQFDTIAYKPHPFKCGPGCEDILRDAGHTPMLLEADPYQFMSMPEVEGALAISSSILREAPYFGVTATSLLTPDRHAHREHYLQAISSRLFCPAALARLIGREAPGAPDYAPPLRPLFGNWGLTAEAQPITLTPIRKSRRNRLLQRLRS